MKCDEFGDEKNKYIVILGDEKQFDHVKLKFKGDANEAINRQAVTRVDKLFFTRE